MEQGILKVTERELSEVEAHTVKIGITVEGENFLYGNAAFDKCEEVKETVEKLKELEPEISIYVKSVYVKSESGWFSKSSKGIYRLEVIPTDLSKINEILGIILDMKNVNMNSLEWVFNDDEIKIELIKKAMIKAKAKAEAMTDVVGYKIVGIRSCSDSYEIPNVNVTLRSSSDEFHDEMRVLKRTRSRASAKPTADIGTEMKGKKEITAIASVEFIIDQENA